MASEDTKESVFSQKAVRLKAAIDGLAAKLYGFDTHDPQLQYENLKTYRGEVCRGFVLHTHLAIEDLLKALLFDFLVKRNRSLSSKTAIRIVDEMKSSDLVHWCGRLKLIRPAQYNDLLELNRVRNACAHNWVLDLPRRKTVGPKAARRRIRIPRVAYNSKNLFTGSIFEDDFCPTYGNLYLNLLLKVWRLQGKI